METKERIEAIEEEIKDVINILQLLEDVLEKGEENAYIQRTIRTIEKMLKEILHSINH